MSDTPDAQEFWDDYQHLKKEVGVLRGTEQRLTETKERYEALFNMGIEIYAVLNSEGRFLEINSYGSNVFQMDQETISKTPSDTFLLDEKSKEVVRRAAAVIRTGNPVQFDWNLRLPGQPTRMMAARLTPIRGSSGDIVSAYLVARDLSELEALKEDLVALQEAAGHMQERVIRALVAARSEINP